MVSRTEPKWLDEDFVEEEVPRYEDEYDEYDEEEEEPDNNKRDRSEADGSDQPAKKRGRIDRNPNP